jgi:hypothetical protein
LEAQKAFALACVDAEKIADAYKRSMAVRSAYDAFRKTQQISSAASFKATTEAAANYEKSRASTLSAYRDAMKTADDAFTKSVLTADKNYTDKTKKLTATYKAALQNAGKSGTNGGMPLGPTKAGGGIYLLLA